MPDLKFPAIKNAAGEELTPDQALAAVTEIAYLPFKYRGVEFHIALDPLRITQAAEEKYRSDLYAVMSEANGGAAPLPDAEGNVRIAIGGDKGAVLMSKQEQSLLDKFMGGQTPAVLGWDVPGVECTMEELNQHAELRKPVLKALGEFGDFINPPSPPAEPTPRENTPSL